MERKQIITRDYLEKLDVPADEIKESTQEMTIVKDTKQYTVRIPAKFAERAKIKKTDKFLFKLIPVNEEGQYTIVGELKRQ
ncbi:MAG: hypothetical protein WC758_05140 [Candidatus Woesearchaeota archaeon]